MFIRYLEYIYDEGYIEDRIKKLAADEGVNNPDEFAKFYADKFKKLRNQHHLDINSFKTLSNLTTTLRDIEEGNIKTKSAVKKDIRKGFIGIKIDKDYIKVETPAGAVEGLKIFIPLNHKASCTIGRDSKWCTTMENDPRHWDNYHEKEVTHFYIFNPLAIEYKYRMMAVSVYDSGMIEVFDKDDRSFPKHELKELIGIDQNKFRSWAEQFHDKIFSQSKGNVNDALTKFQQSPNKESLE
jgi:hypothetical protein